MIGFFVFTLGLPVLYWLKQQNQFLFGYQYQFWFWLCGVGAGLSILLLPTLSDKVAGLKRVWFGLWAMLSGLSIFWSLQTLAGTLRTISNADVILLWFTGAFFSAIPFLVIDFLFVLFRNFTNRNRKQNLEKLPITLLLVSIVTILLAIMHAIRYDRIQVNDSVYFGILTAGIIGTSLFFLTVVAKKKEVKAEENTVEASVLEGFKKISINCAIGIGFCMILLGSLVFFYHTAGFAMLEILGLYALVLFFLRLKPNQKKTELVLKKSKIEKNDEDVFRLELIDKSPAFTFKASRYELDDSSKDNYVTSELIAKAVVKVCFVGNMDFTMEPAMKKISQEVKDAQPKLVIIDLEKLTWLSSTCIGSIVGIYVFCHNNGGAHALVNVDWDTERKLNAYGLGATLTFFESTSKALEAYGISEERKS